MIIDYSIVILKHSVPFGFIETTKSVLEIIIVGDGVAGRLQPPYLRRNLLYSGNFSERAIGNLAGFVTALHIALQTRTEILQPPKFDVLLCLCLK